MTGWGKKLAGVDEEQLRQQLRTETDPKAVRRLTAALLYADGSSPYEIERLLGFPAQTVYDWLDTVAEREGVALGDRPRGGSHSRLTDDYWDQLTATLAASPSEAGIDAPAWRPPLVRDYIADIFGVEYSPAHMYRVMKKAGLSVQTARPVHYEADPAEQRRWRTELKKKKVADAEGGWLHNRRYRSALRGGGDRAKTRLVPGELTPETAGLGRS